MRRLKSPGLKSAATQNVTPKPRSLQRPKPPVRKNRTPPKPKSRPKPPRLRRPRRRKRPNNKFSRKAVRKFRTASLFSGSAPHTGVAQLLRFLLNRYSRNNAVADSGSCDAPSQSVGVAATRQMVCHRWHGKVRVLRAGKRRMDSLTRRAAMRLCSCCLRHHLFRPLK